MGQYNPCFSLIPTPFTDIINWLLCSYYMYVWFYACSRQLECGLQIAVWSQLYSAFPQFHCYIHIINEPTLFSVIVTGISPDQSFSPYNIHSKRHPRHNFVLGVFTDILLAAVAPVSDDPLTSTGYTPGRATLVFLPEMS